MPSQRPRRAALVLCLVAAALAAPSAAWGADPPVPSGPPDGAQVTAGTVVALHARGVAGDTGLYLRISRSPAVVDACGRIAPDVAQSPGTPLPGDPALFDFAVGRWYDTAGTYVWQVHRIAADGSCAAAPARTVVVAAAVLLPRLSRAPIPGRIGLSNGMTFTIRTGGVPAGVTRSRFLTLVRNSGRRWRLHSAGRRPGRAVYGNGRSEVGFSNTLVPFGALAVTITGPRFRAGRVSGRERDLILRGDLPWQPGPAHPDRGQVDLETVLLHEFGHMAGNRGHVARGCRDTPMVIGLAGGEWWRSSRDFFFRDCTS